MALTFLEQLLLQSQKSVMEIKCAICKILEVGLKEWNQSEPDLEEKQSDLAAACEENFSNNRFAVYKCKHTTYEFARKAFDAVETATWSKFMDFCDMPLMLCWSYPK